jgi:microcystin-dependent protein
MKKIFLIAAAVLGLNFLSVQNSNAQDPYLGEIRLFAGNFAPRGWALCQGQTLSIAQNAALFSLLGTTYGGNGQTTFNLPDLRGRTPIGFGQGPGLSNRDLGQQGGVESVTLTINEMPTHSHSIAVSDKTATSREPAGKVLAKVWSGAAYREGSPTVLLSLVSIEATGGNQPHENMQPFLGLNYIIALQGIFPSPN